MIVKCCFTLMRLYNQLVQTGGTKAVHTSVRRSSMRKIVLRKAKSPPKEKVLVWKGMQIRDLANNMHMGPSKVMDAICRVLEINDSIPYKTELHDMTLIFEVAKLCGHSVERRDPEGVPELVDKDVYCRNISLNAERLKPRPAIVTIMGHVDHGKTTLLDSLRSSRIVDQEFGGITQHIGAFKVRLSDIAGGPTSHGGVDNDIVTFLDTPGHAAFSLMRSRGVRCTDIVVLVVAIEDGLMPQTLESIRFAREARVPIIVVVNKVDRLCSKIEDISRPVHKSVFERIRHSLSLHGVVVEEYGGDVQCIPISAMKRWNLGLLQESILALAEVLNIRSDYEGPCEGVVLETKIVEHLGKQATVLLQHGTLKIGSVLVAGHSYAKVRTMKSDAGKMVKEASPGDPIEITGWKDSLPSAGDIVIEVETENRAKEVVSFRKKKVEHQKSEKDLAEYNKKMEAYRMNYRAYVDDGFKKGFRFQADRPQLTEFDSSPPTFNGVQIPQVNLIIKTDVHGSLEAIENVLLTAIESCATQCCLKIAGIGVGNLTDSDIRLAANTQSVVYLFNLPESQEVNPGLHIDVRHFNVIYHMFDDLRDHIQAKLPQRPQCDVIGEAEALQMFEVKESKTKVPVIGCRCIGGTVYRDRQQYFFRVARKATDGSEEMSILQDQLTCQSLKHLREDVECVRKGVECGMVLIDGAGGPVAVEVGDVVQCCKTVFLNQTLKWQLGFQ